MSKSNKSSKNDVDLFGDSDSSQSPDMQAEMQTGTNDFARLFEASLTNKTKTFKAGDRVRGELLTVSKDEAFVAIGGLHDAMIMRQDLLDENGVLKYKVGDFVDVYVTQVQGSNIRVSTKPTAKNISEDIEDAFDMMLPVEGKVTDAMAAGFKVNVMGKEAFCPISQMDLKRIETPQDYVGRKLEFYVTQFSGNGRNIVLSRRKLLEEQSLANEMSFQDEHKVGQIVNGVVSRIESYGAFVELSSGVEGLVHISELSYSRVENPKDVLSMGQDVQAKILKMENDGNRLKISLSIKQAQAEPWSAFPAEIKVGAVVSGKVTRCLKFGAFVELAPGIEGLIPLSEMSHTKNVVRSDELVKPGNQVQVLVKEIRAEDKRISLSLRDADLQFDSAMMNELSKSRGGQAQKGGFGSLADQFAKALGQPKK
jgi:small subunit ribosomal protein S1